jgi:molybdopterin-guanine dinucleotide biosynthesis protein A
MAQEKYAELNGLVLAGGKSVRMHHDKGMIPWHGKAQRYHMADMLNAFCKEVFISCRIAQKEKIDSQYLSLQDQYTDIGPFGGVLSAFQKNPFSAWLVVACDMPLLDSAGIAYLLTQRDPAVLATAYENPEDGLPEPLAAIWEPAAYPLLLSVFQNGSTSLRKILLKNEIRCVKPLRPEILTNINTPEDAAKIKIP